MRDMTTPLSVLPVLLPLVVVALVFFAVVRWWLRTAVRHGELTSEKAY